MIYEGIGEHSASYFEHTGEKWEKTKKEYIEKLWETSKLRGLMFTDTLSNNEQDEILALISQALEEGVGQNSKKENESVRKIQKILNG
ncbi:hypothetical protein LQF59_00860 [Tetragenococcus koreensis]|uniref:hypothetical protein n=1 Tax=Tetragenococcus koreensis TaxID=290335 RepID=UPI001F3A83E4|nr:hypothetical protein [Tetragenococcus koreensis]MCF1613611.1 hypothetical protein [Tetragenococcus koreensis]MCF1623393.1 hypothetical protein [Tetragenococcus koreensis]